MINKLKGKLDFDELFGPNQHSYRPGFSTTTACVVLQDFLASELDKGNIVLLYSADLSSAFDLLRFQILINRLIELKVSSKLVNVIENFLADRSGFVDVGGSFSNLRNILIGCVQGSVLGPVLFNIYKKLR